MEPDGSTFIHPLFMYTHWRGSEIKTVLQTALMRGKERWDDPQYLSRIIFDTLKEGCVDEITGFGLSTALCDNEHDLLLVNCMAETVREIESPSQDSKSDPLKCKEIRRWSFDEYCKLSGKELNPSDE